MPAVDPRLVFFEAFREAAEDSSLLDVAADTGFSFAGAGNGTGAGAGSPMSIEMKLSHAAGGSAVNAGVGSVYSVPVSLDQLQSTDSWDDYEMPDQRVRSLNVCLSLSHSLTLSLSNSFTFSLTRTLSRRCLAL